MSRLFQFSWPDPRHGRRNSGEPPGWSTTCSPSATGINERRTDGEQIEQRPIGQRCRDPYQKVHRPVTRNARPSGRRPGHLHRPDRPEEAEEPAKPDHPALVVAPLRLVSIAGPSLGRLRREGWHTSSRGRMRAAFAALLTSVPGILAPRLRQRFPGAADPRTPQTGATASSKRARRSRLLPGDPRGMSRPSVWVPSIASIATCLPSVTSPKPPCPPFSQSAEGMADDEEQGTRGCWGRR